MLAIEVDGVRTGGSVAGAFKYPAYERDKAFTEPDSSPPTP